jgi:ferric-dicitrate binding protein FerR (iron transport regulator)
LAFNLPDGSSVMLGPESSLSYAGTYGSRVRAVELEGEAYFEVVHDEAKPFEVRAEYAVARDLGTRFIVRARSSRPAVDVVVAEGRVALGQVRGSPSAALVPMTDSLLLDPGELGRLTAAGELTHRRGVALDPYFGWTQGRLVFDAASLADVIDELNRWYDADIRLADSAMSTLRLTATFRDQPVGEALLLIQASLGLALTEDGGRFILAVR